MEMILLSKIGGCRNAFLIEAEGGCLVLGWSLSPNMAFGFAGLFNPALKVNGRCPFLELVHFLCWIKIRWIPKKFIEDVLIKSDRKNAGGADFWDGLHVTFWCCYLLPVLLVKKPSSRRCLSFRVLDFMMRAKMLAGTKKKNHTLIPLLLAEKPSSRCCSSSMGFVFMKKGNSVAGTKMKKCTLFLPLLAEKPSSRWCSSFMVIVFLKRA